MTKRKCLMLLCCMLCTALCKCTTQRDLTQNDWKFTLDSIATEYSDKDYNDAAWQTVSVPHDWAITGPFDRKYDLQNVAVTQNGEKVASMKTGRSGGLPYIGTGWYRRRFDVPQGKDATLVFDGAMSEAQVWVNGQKVGEWPNGYNSFHFNVTPYLNPDGKDNVVAVRLQNRPYSSRWYPGAGLYRNVRLVTTDPVHIPVWGTQITTPHVNDDFATVKLNINVDNAGDKTLKLVTTLTDADGKVVGQRTTTGKQNHGLPFEHNLEIEKPHLWSPESPYLYTATTEIFDDKNSKLDSYSSRFGVRTIEVVPERGFYLNGKLRKFQGVCNHHDLGPLGAANQQVGPAPPARNAQGYGCRCRAQSHNMPAPELVELCDEMGLMMMLEPFDEWDIAKCKNGYHRYFQQWAERDMVNMIHQYRNHPSVVMWSVGNEVPTQCSNEGYKVARFLQDICHREDPGRPVTCGMDQVSCILRNGFGCHV